MSELEELLQELKNMQKKSKNIPNNMDTWAAIKSKNWLTVGFENEEEVKSWIIENPYENI